MQHTELVESAINYINHNLMKLSPEEEQKYKERLRFCCHFDPVKPKNLNSKFDILFEDPKYIGYARQIKALSDICTAEISFSYPITRNARNDGSMTVHGEINGSKFNYIFSSKFIYDPHNYDDELGYITINFVTLGSLEFEERYKLRLRDFRKKCFDFLIEEFGDIHNLRVALFANKVGLKGCIDIVYRYVDENCLSYLVTNEKKYHILHLTAESPKRIDFADYSDDGDLTLKKEINYGEALKGFLAFIQDANPVFNPPQNEERI